jgi:hypothetical protein
VYVHFRNNALNISRRFSMHPHGLFYLKGNEGIMNKIYYMNYCIFRYKWYFAFQKKNIVYTGICHMLRFGSEYSSRGYLPIRW